MNTNPELPLQTPRYNPREYTLALAKTFPGIRRKIEGLTADNFTVEEFIARFKGASTSEKHACNFIVGVWIGPGDDWAKKRRCNFDALEAIKSWDDENLAAFAAWVLRPKFA
jgi:hypothetical protein